MLFYPSANRGEDVFDKPDRFDIFRAHNRHVCLGASLARLELKVMFRELLARLPDLGLASDEAFPHCASNFVSGLDPCPSSSPRGRLPRWAD